MVKSIPRFEISYGPAAFAAACRATLAGEVPPARDLASVLGDRQLIWTGSGSQALSLVLVALKLGRGARVAIPLFSPAAVATAVEAAGCQPLYVDVDPRTLTMDPREVARVRERVAAIVPVHLFGNVAEMDRLMDAARRVPVIEDTVQCVTGSWRGRRAGTFGVASFYSFGPAKCIAAGAGGLLAVNGTALAADMRQLAPKLRARKETESLRSAATQLVHSMLSSHGLCRLSAYRDEHSDPVASVDAHAIPPSAAAAVPQLLRGFAGRMHRQRDNSLRLIDFLRPASGVVLPIEPASAIFCYTFFWCSFPVRRNATPSVWPCCAAAWTPPPPIVIAPRSPPPKAIAEVALFPSMSRSARWPSPTPPASLRRTSSGSLPFFLTHLRACAPLDASAKFSRLTRYESISGISRRIVGRRLRRRARLSLRDGPPW